MSNYHIPSDLVYEILSRLPVKSLLKFKCVAKSWYMIIESPEFITKHALQSENIDSSKKFIAGVFDDLSPPLKLYAFPPSFPESSKVITTMEEISYPSVMKKYSSLSYVDSCNGLLCLVFYLREPSTILWNPFTQEYRLLPSCSKLYRSHVDDRCFHGFGYDKVTDDYKVVMLVINYNLNKSYFDNPVSKCLIYSLNSNEWKCLEDFPPIVFWWMDGVHVNGALHWHLVDNSILAFNLRTEKCELIPIPRVLEIAHPLVRPKGLAIACPLARDGCLSLLCKCVKEVTCDIWVMKEYGDKDSWIKLTYDVPNYLGVLIPYQRSRNGKYLFLKELNEKYVLYNFEEQSFKQVKFPCYSYNATACFYCESLVKINGYGAKASNQQLEEE